MPRIRNLPAPQRAEVFGQANDLAKSSFLILITGRPNVAEPLGEIEKLLPKGLSWRVLEAQTGIAKDTLRRAFMSV